MFHSEHNRLVDDIKDVITTEDPTMLSEWQLGAGTWNGERLFQAARFVTEMEYQHLAFEEFARKVQPQVNLFSGYDTSRNPAITGEFAHAVYRFGHSMLTETVARIEPNGTTRHDVPLLDAFLNPPSFDEGGLTPDQAAGNIMRGMSKQVGNELDEFVTEALRNRLLGLPLDLATLNLARGRDTGMPPLNVARRQFYAATNNNAALQPYSSWIDFGLGLRHHESLMNFVAAYGTHPSISGSLAAKRSAAEVLVANDPLDPATPADAAEFMNSTGSWAAQETGLDLVDLWVGGLAEKQAPFGGLLGSTFNYVFETQMEDLQDGDRMYYLTRTAGLNLLVQLEGNSFAELIERNTDVTDLPPTRSPGRTGSSTSPTWVPPGRSRTTPARRTTSRSSSPGRRLALCATTARCTSCSSAPRVLTRCRPASVTTRCGATVATTAPRVVPATTPSWAVTAWTSSPTASVTTSSRVGTGPTPSTPAQGST